MINGEANICFFLNLINEPVHKDVCQSWGKEKPIAALSICLYNFLFNWSVELVVAHKSSFQNCVLFNPQIAVDLSVNSFSKIKFNVKLGGILINH